MHKNSMLVTGCVNMCYILLICHQSDSSNLSKYPTIMWFIAYLYVCVCMLSSVHSAITVHLMCLMFLPSSPDKSTTSESLFHDETHLVTWHKSHQPGLRAPLLAGRLWLLREHSTLWRLGVHRTRQGRVGAPVWITPLETALFLVVRGVWSIWGCC